MFRIAMALFVSILEREHEPSLSRTRTRGIESAIYLIWGVEGRFTTDGYRDRPGQGYLGIVLHNTALRSEEHTSELQSLMRISYAVFCLKKKKKQIHEIIQ